MMSVKMFPPALMYHCGILGMHLPVLAASESQKALMGVQMKIWTKSWLKLQPPTKMVAAMRILRIFWIERMR